MARNLNKVLLIGNVAHDPEVQKTASGKKVAHVSLATSRRIPRNDKFHERTKWHRVTLWDRLAKIAAEFVRKGDRIYVEGRLAYGSYERDGVTIPTTEIVVQELILLGSPLSPANATGENDPWD